MASKTPCANAPSAAGAGRAAGGAVSEAPGERGQLGTGPAGPLLSGAPSFRVSPPTRFGSWLGGEGHEF